MRDFPSKKCTSQKICLLLSLVLILAPLGGFGVRARSNFAETQESKVPAADIFRLERKNVEGGAELITVFARLDGLQPETPEWVPLVTVMRDTLGDADFENDRLRYVWPLTYTRPSLKQRVLSAVPFFYNRAGNKAQFSGTAPPPAMDLARPDSDVWNKIFWTALQNILLDPYGTPVKASTRSYRRNINDYRKSHIIRALSILSLYQSVNGLAAFSDAETAEIHSRLVLSDKTFGGLVDPLHLQTYYEKSTTQQRDERGHNWELLRQRAEAESLYFEPLQLPDGSMTHALIWIARSELGKKPEKPFSKRFLNFSDPWSDKRLLDWKGYSEIRYFDRENRPVPPETSGARAVEMIPIALYGLDNPKIPMLLIDFRDGLNPKKREMSRRVLQDITRNLLAVSRFGNLPYFLGRTVFDFVTGRRGIDVNQPSRLRTYSQLKLLLSLENSLNPELQQEITNRLERVSLNPLENDLDVEAKLARQQYEALLAYAGRPDGLPAKLKRDRRLELVPLEHGKTERVLFRLANILTFGKYVHREEATGDMGERLDLARRMDYHTNFLREVAKSKSQIEVAWNLADVRRSLRFVADYGAQARSSAVKSAARIFAKTNDDETRHICLDSLARINSRQARAELLRISENMDLDASWKDTINSYLSRAEPAGTSGAEITAKTGSRTSGQQ